MSALPRIEDLRSPKYGIPLFIFLVAAGLAGNYYPISILNLHFILGSIFAMLALQMFGLGWGILAAAIISSYTYLNWNHPYAIITMTGEVAIAGWLFSRRRVTLVMADTLYWIFIGIPMGFCCFYFIAHLSVSNALFLMMKQSMNGIANALIARLIFTGYALPSRSSTISFRENLSNLLLFFAILSMLVLLILGSKLDFEETEHQIRKQLLHDSLQATDSLNNWITDRENIIAQLAIMAKTLTPDQMQTRLAEARASHRNFLRMALLDKEGITVAYSPPKDELGRDNISKNFGDRPYIPQLKGRFKPVLSEVMPSRFGRTGIVTIVLAPVVSQGKYDGAVGGIIIFDRIKEILETNFSGQSTLYTLVDRKGRVILTNRKDQTTMAPFSRGEGNSQPISEKLSQWIPSLPPNISTIELWGRSLYVAETTIGQLGEWRLILEQPVAPFQEMLYNRYSRKIVIMFIILISLLGIAALLSRRVTSTVERLSQVTAGLPEKVASNQTIDWPESGIEDTRHLVANFREMANSLQTQFKEIKEINESLESQIESRTRELQTSKDKLSSAVEMARLGHWEFDTVNDLFTFNDEFYQIFHTNVDEAGGYTMSSAEYARRFVHPDDARIVEQEISEAKETTDPDFSRQLEHRIVRADGTTGHISVRFFVVKDTDGRTVKTYGVNQDITERKMAEGALRESQERLNAIFVASPDPLLVYDTQGRPIYLNPAFERVFGWTLDELAGRKIPFVPEDQEEVTQREIRKLYDSGIPVRLETKRLTQDGRIVDILINAALMYDARGESAGMVVNLTDITERKGLESQLQQAQKMESVGRLAGGVAHDFNNKLTAILGYTELALGRLDPSDALYADLHKVLEAGNQSTNIVRQLLAFARKQTIAPKVMILNDTVEQMLKMLRRLIGEDIDLAWEPGGNLWLVNMDPTQIDQILANLCVNARDAIEGVGKVTIETQNMVLDEAYCAGHAGFVPGEYVMLAVSDDGIGMDKETLANVFEPFFTTKEVGKGTGLGLSTVYGIVKQNHGFVNIYSEPGRGTTVKIYLRRHEGEAEGKAEVLESEIPRGQGETVLLVEDEKTVLQLGQQMLERLGYTVLATESPVEAVEMVREDTGDIHLLMTDVVMPGMSGKDLAEEIQNIRPDIKALFMSGYTANVIAHQGVLDEGAHFIQKPFSMQGLSVKVRDALDKDTG